MLAVRKAHATARRGLMGSSATFHRLCATVFMIMLAVANVRTVHGSSVDGNTGGWASGIFSSISSMWNAESGERQASVDEADEQRMAAEENERKGDTCLEKSGISTGGPIIGIDLGTTFCAVGVSHLGQIKVISNEEGKRLTPSYVSFGGENVVVGNTAKLYSHKRPKQTIYNVKRMIGRRMDSDEMLSYVDDVIYDVVSKDNRPFIKVEHNAQTLTLPPQAISALVLGKIKANAESFLGTEVKDAVITVPAYFSDEQRLATREAGKLAGLNVVRLLNEPTAAALAYGLNIEKEETIMVFDFGGGTFDVSVVRVQDDEFRVLSIKGDSNLGGEDFDKRLIDHLADTYLSRSGVDPRSDPKAYMKLKREAESVKVFLSTQQSVEAEVVVKGEEMLIEVTRAEFEEMCKDLFDRIEKPMDEALKDKNLERNDIDRLVLVGGSSRIPKVRDVAHSFFGKREGLVTEKGVEKDEAVAYGATVLGQALHFKTSQACRDENKGDDTEEGGNSLTATDPNAYAINVIDVIPMSLGVRIKDDTMAVMFKKNTQRPNSVEKRYSTVRTDQDALVIAIYEGEMHGKGQVHDNHFLGSFEISNLPNVGRLLPVVVKFQIDDDGVLEVTSRVEGYDHLTGDIHISAYGRGALSEDDFDAVTDELRRIA